MTIGDKMRAMTDEQLARYICKNFFYDCEACQKCPAAAMCTVNSNGMVKLIRQEVQDEKVSTINAATKEEGY